MVYYVQLEPSNIIKLNVNNVKDHTWLELSCAKVYPKNGKRVLAGENMDSLLDFEMSLRKICAKKYYNHYLVKTKDIVMLRTFMVATMTGNDTTIFKYHFGIASALENKKMELLKKHPMLQYKYKGRSRRVFNSRGNWYVIYKNAPVKIEDNEIMNGSFSG